MSRREPVPRWAPVQQSMRTAFGLMRLWQLSVAATVYGSTGISGTASAAAAGAIIVGGDDESLGRIDRLAVEHQIPDATGAGVQHLAFRPVLRRRRQVDPVADAVDDVEIARRQECRAARQWAV